MANTRIRLSEFPRTCWAVNTMEIFERMAWYGFFAVSSLYITGAVEDGGLGFSDEDRGVLQGVTTFFLYLFPVVTGALADRYGYKRMLFAAYCVLVPAYYLLRREAELERRHRNFLSAITHELKSPLAAVRLSLETVLAGRSDEESGRRFLTNALQDAERLQDLVQKVLETTRYGHGPDALRHRSSSVSHVVERAVDASRSRLEAAGGRIHAEIQCDVWADIDDEALAIAVSNLIENAVKSGGSPPRVGVRLAVDGDRAVLEVSDNGSGVAAEDQPFIFDRFYRAGDELSRTSRGTGLGLHLVQQIVRAHRGTVGIASTGSEGTIFRAELPGAELKEGGP